MRFTIDLICALCLCITRHIMFIVAIISQQFSDTIQCSRHLSSHNKYATLQYDHIVLPFFNAFPAENDNCDRKKGIPT